MVTLRCSRCAGTCQIPPHHEGRLHTCEHCGLVLTVPGKPAPRPRPRQSANRRFGVVEALVCAGAVVSLVAAVLTILVVSNRPSRVVREAAEVGAERPAGPRVQPTAAPAPVVTVQQATHVVADRLVARPQALAVANQAAAVVPAAAEKVLGLPVSVPQVAARPTPGTQALAADDSVIVIEEQEQPSETVVIVVPTPAPVPAPTPAKVMPAFSPVQTDASRSSEIAAVIESASSASGEGLPIANFSFEAQPADYTEQVTGWNKDSDSHLAQKICQTPQKKNAHGQKYLELYHDLGQKPADGSCAIRTAQAVGIYKPGMRYTLKVLLSRSGDAQAERSVVISLSTLSGKVVSQTIALTQIPENEFAEFATILDTSTNRKCIGQEIYATVEFMARKGQWGRALDVDNVRVLADPIGRR